MRQCLEGMPLIANRDETLVLGSLPDEVVEEVVVLLVVKEDCSGMVLYDRPLVGEGSMSITHL